MAAWGPEASGPFRFSNYENNFINAWSGTSGTYAARVAFNASFVVPVSNENRPISIALPMLISY